MGFAGLRATARAPNTTMLGNSQLSENQSVHVLSICKKWIEIEEPQHICDPIEIV